MSNKTKAILIILAGIVLDHAIGLTNSNPTLTVEDIAVNIQDNKNDLNDTLIPGSSLIIGKQYAKSDQGIELAVESILHLEPAF